MNDDLTRPPGQRGAVAVDRTVICWRVIAFGGAVAAADLVSGRGVSALTAVGVAVAVAGVAASATALLGTADDL